MVNFEHSYGTKVDFTELFSLLSCECESNRGQTRDSFARTSDQTIMWNLGKLQVFPAGSSPPREPHEAG